MQMIHSCFALGDLRRCLAAVDLPVLFACILSADCFGPKTPFKHVADHAVLP